MGTKIVFETELEQDYDLYNDPIRRDAMMGKIRSNVKIFGSLEIWHNKLCDEVLEQRRSFEARLHIWWTWREQLEFVRKVMKGEIKMTQPQKGVDLN